MTAETIKSVSLTASAAEAASRTPDFSPAALSGAPPVCANKMSQAAMRSTPASRRPAAIACPASPKPIKETRGVLRRGMPYDSGTPGTGGVPLVWNERMVCRPQAWPFLRSVSLQVIGFQSGASTSRAPAQDTSTRLPPGSYT